MSLSFGYSPWWLIPALLGAAALTYWTYHETRPSLPTGKKLLLGGLRFSAFGLILALLLQPILNRVQVEEQAPTLAVLVDDSRSLEVAAEDSGAAVAQMRTALETLRSSSLSAQIRYFRFASGTRNVSPAQLDTIRPRGPRTDVSRAFRTATRRLDGENLRGIVLLSDGQYNTGRNPIYEAEETAVPIFPIALGDTIRPRDVQIRTVRTNDIAYRDTRLPVRVQVQSRGYGGESVTVSVYRGDERLDTTRTTLSAGPSERTVELEVVPAEAGLRQYRVAVDALPGEQTEANNEAYTQVRVLERRKRILLLAGAPSPDVAAWVQLLERTTESEVVRRVQRESGGFYEGPLPDAPTEFDALILAGYPGPASTPGNVDRIAEAAREVPVLYLFQRQGDLEMLRDRLYEPLPAHPETIRSGVRAIGWETTPQGRGHPIFRLSPRDSSAWDRLPPLTYGRTTWTPSPDARVLARIEEQNVVLDDPLLVVRQRSGHRSAALLAAETDRWLNVPERIETAGSQWRAAAGNLIQWLTARETDQPVRVRPTQSVFDSRETVTFSGQVYDESLNPVDEAAVEVEITAPDGTTSPHPMEPEGNGQYALSVGTLPAGTYEYTATARLEGEELGTDRGSFAVGSVALEYLEPRANVPLLRQIATRSGGRMVSTDSLNRLPAVLRDHADFEPRVERRPQEAHLWRWPGLLVLAILLLGSEWALRKKNGLT